MLNALLTPFKAGLRYLSPNRPPSATDEVRGAGGNLTTPPNRTSSVTFLRRAPPDEDTPPGFSQHGAVTTSTSTRPASDWRYYKDSKAGRDGREALLTMITARAAQHGGYLNFRQESYAVMMDVLESLLKQKNIWHLFDIPKQGTGRISSTQEIELSNYGNIFHDHSVTLNHVIAYVNFGAGAGRLVLPVDTNLPFQRTRPDLESGGPERKLAVLQFDIQWASDLLTDILVVLYGQSTIEAMQYEMPSVVSIGTQDRVQHLEGFIILRKILSQIRPPKLADISSKLAKFNGVSILDTDPEDLTHAINSINRWRHEVNSAAKKEKISEEDVAERIKDSVQGSKYLDFVSETNKSYLKYEKGTIPFQQFCDDSKDSFALASEAKKPTALALVTERQTKVENQVKNLQGRWQRPPSIKTDDQDRSHKSSAGQGDMMYKSRGTRAHVKGSKLDDHGDEWNPYKFNGVDSKFCPFANRGSGEWFHLCKEDHRRDNKGKFIPGSWMYCKPGHDHAVWIKERKSRNKSGARNKRDKPSSSVETPTNAEKTTSAGPSRLRLKQAFVSKSICMSGGLAKEDAEKMFEEIMEDASSKE